MLEGVGPNLPIFLLVQVIPLTCMLSRFSCISADISPHNSKGIESNELLVTSIIQRLHTAIENVELSTAMLTDMNRQHLES